MIAELLFIPLLLLVFAGWGCWAKILFAVKTDSLVLSIISGLALFGFIACMITFFAPLDITVEILLLAIAVIPYLLKSMRIRLPSFHKEVWKSYGFWFFLILIISAGSYYTFQNDHFWYYIPSVKWLNHFGLILGTANVDWFLGQMSFIHIIQAGIDETIEPYERLCIFITILFLIYIFERRTYLFLIFIPFYFLFFQSLSPDIPTVFFSLIVVNEICFYYDKSRFKLLFLIAAFTFVIKPIAFWLPLWVFMFALFKDRNELKSLQNYVFPSLLILVFIIKNYVTVSLIYPVSYTLINTYWAPDSQLIEISDQLAQVLAYDTYYNIDEIRSFSFFEKIYRMFTLPNIQVVIHTIIAITILIFGIFSLLKKQFLFLSLFFIALIKLAVICSFSGQYRFILDITYPMIFLLFSQLHRKRVKILSVSALLFITAFLIVSFPQIIKVCIPSYKLTEFMSGFSSKSLLMPENYACREFRAEKIGNFTFNVSIECFYNHDTPPPALTLVLLKRYYNLNIFPQWKDPDNIRKGIYVKTLSEDEKAKLGEIIGKME